MDKALAVLKVRQFTVWDYSIASLLHFFETLGAKCYTVFNPLIPAFCYRYSGDNIPSAFDIPVIERRDKMFSTHCTPCKSTTEGVFFTLSIPGTGSNPPYEPSSSKLGHNSPPLKRWDKCVDNYFYILDGRETGIHIVKVTYLWLAISKSKVITPLKLPHPIFRISFTPPYEDYAIMEITVPTLKEAKKLAEWYYEERSKVNDETTTKID